MNSDAEIAAYRRAFEELERFGRVLAEGEEATELEELLQLEYDDDAVLRALGEEDQTWMEISARSRPETAAARWRNL